jgi:hypothetical protein
VRKGKSSISAAAAVTAAQRDLSASDFSGRTMNKFNAESGERKPLLGEQQQQQHGGNKKRSNSPPSTNRRKEVTAEDIRGTLNFDKFGAHDRETSLNSSTIEESLRLSRKYEREKLGENVTPHHHHRKEISVSLAAAAEETFY